MAKWLTIGEWGDLTPGSPVIIRGVFLTHESRKPHKALERAERAARMKLHPPQATFWRYVIVTPDGRRFGMESMRRMLAGPKAKEKEHA